MARPKKQNAMLEMANPEILARMKAPEEKPKRRNRTILRRMQEAELAKKAKAVVPADTSETGDPFAESRKIARGGRYKVGELNDFKLRTALPSNGKCTCGSKPFSWKDAKKPEIQAFCSHVAHGGNGRFWLYELMAPIPKKRGRKPKEVTLAG